MAISIIEILKFLFPEYQILDTMIKKKPMVREELSNISMGREKKKNSQNTTTQQDTPIILPVQNTFQTQQQTVQGTAAQAGQQPLQNNPAQAGQQTTPNNISQAGEPPVQNTASQTPVEQQDTKNPPAANTAPAQTTRRVYYQENDVFDDIARELKPWWIGTENDRRSLCRAFGRPFLCGHDIIHPKNTILIIGSESRGRVYAVQCIISKLHMKKIINKSSICKLDMDTYMSDTDQSLFLRDLYKALNSIYDCVVFDNIDKASLPQLDIIYQLMSNGSYRLTKQSVTGISAICANGRFFVFVTSMPQTNILTFLGNRFVKEIGDIISLDPLTNSLIADLVDVLCRKMVLQCQKNLHIYVQIDPSVIFALKGIYQENIGAKGLYEYMEEHIYDPMAEMKLQHILYENASITVSYDTDYYITMMSGEKIYTSPYIKIFYSIQLEEIKRELNQMIGLAKVKEYILNLETNYKVQNMREEKGLTASNVSMHMIFTGNPGTGKTTMARIVAKYLKALGILSSGHLAEVTRSDLVGQYVGQTAIKTADVIRSAVGGVLFIDEAYSLCRYKNDIYGLEAIDTLVKGMEDNRDDLVVILAGYEEEMQEFLKVNSGLKSRFPNIVYFEDYSAEEMYAIAEVTAKSKGYKLHESCREGLLHIFEKHQIKGKNDSGNGRLVRNLIESAILAQSKRISNHPEENMELLTESDFGLDKVEEFDLEQSLAKVIGLENVKNLIRTQYIMLQADKKRKEANYKFDTTQSFNMIFMGNPGTGKTTMARITAEMFRAMGILKSGQLVETNKAGLIAQYLGQTAQKTEEVFKSALGGILFIDEAYAITNDRSSYGQECVDTLVQLIEEYRGEIVVILAGYSKEMNMFLKANSGLESRFPLKIDFPDYSERELYEIGRQMIMEKGFVLNPEAESTFYDEIVELKKSADASSGNGRLVRNYVEEIIRNQSLRIVKNNVPDNELTTILPSDIRPDSSSSDNFDLETELGKVIGLSSVKDYIRSLNAKLRMQEERKKAGLQADNTQTMHMIFTGNPGTGKTMMARTVANVLYHMNIIHTNKLIEIDRSGLVAGYVGQTALKTRQVIENALDGVLFIDEAYSLAKNNDFGQEAIDTLVKMMDDNRERLVVILAGYSEDMDHFLRMNPGLRSRFANIIHFPDYTTEELMQIADSFYAGQGYALDDEGRNVLRTKFDAARQYKQFGNGRYVRNVFERSLNNQALRLSKETSFTKESLVTITAADIK